MASGFKVQPQRLFNMSSHKEFDCDKADPLLAELSKYKDDRGKLWIGIDGAPSTGKTKLSYRIAAACDFDKVINIDDHLNLGQGNFIERINLSILRRNIALYNNKSLIIEGCCLREVLHRLSVSCDILIYCREISELTRIWHAQEVLAYTQEEGTEDKLRQLDGLDLEVAKYHKVYKPNNCVNYIYNLINQLKRAQVKT